MIIRIEPVVKALQSVSSPASHTVFLTPAGIPYDQQKAHELSKKDELILICGHYEGIDARICEYVDECISIGDYILSGGETAALVLLDSICRLQEGVIRAEDYSGDPSFSIKDRRIIDSRIGNGCLTVAKGGSNKLRLKRVG